METADKSSTAETLLNTNGAVMVGLALLFILRRSTASSTPSINFIKGKLRTLGAWMTKFSIVCLFIYMALISFLSTKMDIQKVDVDLSRSLISKYVITYKSYSVDLVILMLYTLKLSSIFMVSALFLTIPLCHSNHSTLASFSKLWAIFRIPAYMYFETVSILSDKDMIVFLREIVSTVEFMAASLFLVLARPLSSERDLSMENTSILSLTSFAYCIIKHVLNLIDFPFKFNQEQLQIALSLQLGLEITLHLLLISIFCPQKRSVFEDCEQGKAIKHLEVAEDTNSAVTLISPLIEFDESHFKY